MKTLFFVLLVLNLALGGWLWLGGPVDTIREPGRLGLQVVPEAFKPLTDAELARMRGQAEHEAALAAARTAAATAAAAAPTELPQGDCVLILNLSSEGAARKLRARLAEAGLGDRIANESEFHRLRVTGVDGAAEERIHQVLREYPKLALEHCLGARGAH